MATLINTVVVKTTDQSPIRKSLLEWIELYSDQLEDDFEFRLYRTDDETVVVEPGSYLDNMRFAFLIIYLVYPDIDYIKDVTGYTLIDDSNELSPGKTDEQIMMFVPSFDEGDSVYWLTSDNKAYKTDMGFKTVEVTMTKQFDIPELDFTRSPAPEIIRNGDQQITVQIID
ncbi:MAG TPA: hypothetical protein VHM26_15835 [Chitinophagaceae bacterium]|jgi:uncharacterized protein YjdB|nr:hypothetical protein [Chitinophagaceae bacterium]